MPSSTTSTATPSTAPTQPARSARAKQRVAHPTASGVGLITNLDSRHLSLLEQLDRLRSVTAAAAALGQHQPTVSIWLGQLRRALGDPLPTPHMQSLLPTVRSVLEGLRRLHEPAGAFDPASATRNFTVCMTDASHITLLPPLLERVQHVAPGATLTALRIDGQTATDLQSSQADLALGHLPWLEAGFYQQALFDQDWICLARLGHPRIGHADGRVWDRTRYEREGHIGILSGTGQALLDEALRRHHVQRRVVLHLPGFLGLAGLLASSDLVSTLPRQIGETLARHVAAGPMALQVLPCPFPVQGFVVKQHWHARVHHDAANVWLRGVCAELFGVGGVDKPTKSDAAGRRGAIGNAFS
jgi:DNA-binding transcriptional LysR family regulator